MKNKKYTDEQNISLFDGHEDMINEIAESEPENTVAADIDEPIEEATESSTPFVIEEAPKDDEPYHDESEIISSEDSQNEEESLEDNAECEEHRETATEEESEHEEIAEPQNNGKAPAPAEEKPRRIDSIFDFVELFIFTLAAVFIITSFFFKYSNVLGDSMQNTLQSGEKLVLTNFFYTPEQGDIVVIDDRSLRDPIVKRVIAVGGQRVKITNDAIYVDGEKLVEDYVYINQPNYQYSVVPCEALRDKLVGYRAGEYYEILVPENEIFVMGDHRNNSSDSRDIGTLHEDAVLGKAVIRFFPIDNFGKIE